MRLRSSFSLIFALVSMPAVVAAQSRSSFAEGLFTEGKALMQAGDYEAACPKLSESDRLEPALGTKLNLASCEAGRGPSRRRLLCFARWRSGCPRATHAAPWARRPSGFAQRANPAPPLLTLHAGPLTRPRMGDLVLESSAFGTRLPIDPDA
jgi:hypothetical protein